MTDRQMGWEIRRVRNIGPPAIVGAIVGGILAPNDLPKGSPVPPGIVFGLVILATGVGYALDRVFNPKPGDDAPSAPAAPPTPAAPAAPEFAQQVREIANSGNEPALIVEELRRLTEVRP